MKLLACFCLFYACASLSFGAVITNKVWMVVYDPFPTNSGKAHLWEVFDPADTWALWNNPYKQNSQLAELIHMATHSNVVVITTRTNVFRHFPLLRNGKRYYYEENGPEEQDNFWHSYKSPWDMNLYNSPFDYDHMLLNELENAEEIMGTGEVDQIYIWSPPGGGGYESLMVGPGSWWCNSTGHTGNDGYRNYPRRWIVWMYNYERGTDMAFHNHGHMAESHMSHFTSGLDWNYATRQNPNKRLDNIWNTYAAVDAWHPDNAAIGDCHRRPNSEHDYDFHNMRFVRSSYPNWQGTNFLSWPHMHMHTQVNRDTWHDQAFHDSIYAHEGEGSHLRWFFQNMPHLPRESPHYMTNGVLMNWYEYLWNYNFSGLELESGVERYDGPHCDLRGYLSYYITIPQTNVARLTIEVTGSLNVDLYVRKDYVAVPPGRLVSYSAYDIAAQGQSAYKKIELTPDTTPAVSPGRWYFTVHAPHSSTLKRGEVRVRATYMPALEPEDPYIDILTDATTVPYETTQYTLHGTNNHNVVGMWWSNALTRAHGTLSPGTPDWSIPSVSLGVGANVISIFGTNVYGTPAQSTVSITRQDRGTTYYIGHNGDDANDGLTPLTAFGTFLHATEALENNDTLIILAGTYTNPFNRVGATEPTLYLGRKADNSDLSDVTFRGEGPHKTVLLADASGPAPNDTVDNAVIVVQGTRNRLESLTVAGDLDGTSWWRPVIEPRHHMDCVISNVAVRFPVSQVERTGISPSFGDHGARNLLVTHCLVDGGGVGVRDFNHDKYHMTTFRNLTLVNQRGSGGRGIGIIIEGNDGTRIKNTILKDQANRAIALWNPLDGVATTHVENILWYGAPAFSTVNNRTVMDASNVQNIDVELTTNVYGVPCCTPSEHTGYGWQETTARMPPAIGPNALIFPAADSYLFPAYMHNATSIVWNAADITDVADGMDVMISQMQIHPLNDSTQTYVITNDVHNLNGYITWYVPEELIDTLTPYVLNFTVMNSADLTAEKTFEHNAFYIIPEPFVAVWFVIGIGAVIHRRNRAYTQI